MCILHLFKNSIDTLHKQLFYILSKQGIDYTVHRTKAI